MVAAGNDFTTSEAVKAKSLEDVKTSEYEKATRAIADDLDELEKLIHRDLPCELKTLFTPELETMSPPKRQKADATPPKVQYAPKPPTPTVP